VEYDTEEEHLFHLDVNAPEKDGSIFITVDTYPSEAFPAKCLHENLMPYL